MFSMTIGAKERVGGVLFSQLYHDMVVKNCKLMIDCFLSKLYLEGEVLHNGAFPTWWRGDCPPNHGSNLKMLIIEKSNPSLKCIAINWMKNGWGGVYSCINPLSAMATFPYCHSHCLMTYTCLKN